MAWSRKQFFPSKVLNCFLTTERGVCLCTCTPKWEKKELAHKFIRNYCWGLFGRLIWTQLCFHYISFLNIWFGFCCFSTYRAIFLVSVNANLKEWMKLWFFIVLFAQSSIVLRQSPGKLFAVCHHMKVFGKTMWDFPTHLLPANFVRKLAEEGAVSQVTVPHHTTDGRFSVISVFKLSPQLKSSPHTPPHTLLSSSLCPCTLDCCTL